MLDVSGLAAVPEDHNVREVKTGSGYYLDFNIVSQSKGMEGQAVFHKYRANMWIPDKDVDFWREKIVHGTVLKFAGAKWAAEQKEDKKFPMNILKLDFKNIVALKKALWLED